MEASGTGGPGSGLQRRSQSLTVGRVRALIVGSDSAPTNPGETTLKPSVDDSHASHLSSVQMPFH